MFATVRRVTGGIMVVVPAVAVNEPVASVYPDLVSLYVWSPDDNPVIVAGVDAPTWRTSSMYIFAPDGVDEKDALARNVPDISVVVA